MDLLEYIKNYGCRVLHISSDVYNEDHLCIECENGIIKYLTVTELKEVLTSVSSSEDRTQTDIK